jgi:predicted AlkP superfamily pyrophosphatase or phosphodiesterase
MRHYGYITLLLLILCGKTLAADARVMIVSIDGLRPDLAMRANMPVLRSLLERGSYTLWATTTPVAVTTPSHTSMLTGVTVERHGISGNDDKSVAAEKLLVPTIFDLAKDAEIDSVLVAGKSKFNMLASRATHAWVTHQSVTTDQDVADHALQMLREYQPRLMVVHFPQVDSVGHARGWGTVDQIRAIENADLQLGRLLDELKAQKRLDETTIIVSSDHGGSGRTHGANDERSRFIPWIIVGPEVRKNIDLTINRELNVQTYDTFATACFVLGITVPADIDGKVITQVFETNNLLQTASTQPKIQTQPKVQPQLQSHPKYHPQPPGITP